MTNEELKLSIVLKRLLDLNRETITSVSKATGVPKSTISEWLGNRTPNPVQAAKVANFLGVSLHYFLFGAEDSQEPIQKILTEDIFKGTFEVIIKRVNIEDK